MARKLTGPLGKMSTESNGTIKYSDSWNNPIKLDGATNSLEPIRSAVMSTKYKPSLHETNRMESLRGSKVS